jgi:uncharacterized protein (TIGR02452 family)
MLESGRLFKRSSFNDMSSDTITDFEYIKIKRTSKYILSEHIEKLTTVEAILQNYHRGKVIALNFANAIFPGGVYIIGGNAQEESLCRSSMLFYTIRKQKQYYINNICSLPFTYTDTRFILKMFLLSGITRVIYLKTLGFVISLLALQ